MKSKPMNPRTELINLNDLVHAALNRAKEGYSVDVADIEGRAERLCEFLLALPALEARPYAARLEKLIGAMNQLEDAMTASFGRIMSTQTDAHLHAE